MEVNDGGRNWWMMMTAVAHPPLFFFRQRAEKSGKTPQTLCATWEAVLLAKTADGKDAKVSFSLSKFVRCGPLLLLLTKSHESMFFKYLLHYH
jgi:hypothetical protein